MALVNRVVEAMESTLKALQGEPITPNLEVARGKLSGALAELKEKVAEEGEEDEDAT
ncbi:MAG: hypothetical protein V3S55_13935 [Nitrospiraceae bacterium]